MNNSLFQRSKSGKITLYGAVFAVISWSYFYTALVRAFHSPLWMDEVLAVIVAQQANVSGIFRAIWTGTDFSPPTFHLLLHVMPGIAADGVVISRLPSIVAAFCAALCVFRIAVRRFETPVAIIAFGITLGSPLFDYAVQARQYALTTCLLAAALTQWDAIPSVARCHPWRLVGLWAALAACVSLHFYGLVAIGALILCESLWAWSNRSWRLPVWGALAAVGPVFVAWLPLARHLRTISSADQVSSAFYGYPSAGRFIGGFISLAIGGSPQLLFYGGLVFASLLAILIPRTGTIGDFIADRPRFKTNTDSNLVIIMIGLCAIPLGAFLLALLATGSFVPRYAVGVTLLPGLAIATLLHALPRPVFAALLMVPFVDTALTIQSVDLERTPEILSAMDVLRDAPDGETVLVDDGLIYIELVGALPPAQRTRLAYVAWPKAVQNPDPTNENEVLRLSTFDPRFQVVTFENAMARPGGFTMLRSGPALTDRVFLTAVRDHRLPQVLADNGSSEIVHIPSGLPAR